MTDPTNREQRTTRDGFVGTSRTLDALRPLIDGVKNIERRIDRLAVDAEKRRADEADRQLQSRFDGVAERIYASVGKYRVSEAFERRLETIFGKASKND